MKSLLALTAAAAAAATLAAPSGAFYRVQHHKSFHEMSRAEVTAYLHRQVWHDRTAIRWLIVHRPPQRLLLMANVTTRWAHDVQWFTTSERIATSHLRALRPRPQAAPSTGIAHEALWECIHRGEGAWNAETGNGYHGGLQMTYGWGGLVGDAGLLSPEQQMAAAESGYRRSGYSLSWLGSQWPQTLYFRNGPHGEPCTTFV